jgi:hypothetical protein
MSRSPALVRQHGNRQLGDPRSQKRASMKAGTVLTNAVAACHVPDAHVHVISMPFAPSPRDAPVESFLFFDKTQTYAAGAAVNRYVRPATGASCIKKCLRSQSRRGVKGLRSLPGRLDHNDYVSYLPQSRAATIIYHPGGVGRPLTPTFAGGGSEPAVIAFLQQPGSKARPSIEF